MSSIDIAEREITAAELERIKVGFDEHAIEHGNPKETADRFAFVAVDGERFVGSSSGLVYKKTAGYSNWFYITDLFVEKPFRGQGIGSELLQLLEKRVMSLGVRNIWTWTAGYEAPEFYKKQGYQVFCEMDNWYSSGHSRIGLWKALGPSSRSNKPDAGDGK